MRWFTSLSRMAFSLPLAALAAAALIAINETGYMQSTAAVREMVRTQETRAALNHLLQYVLDAETGQRGFLLTGDNRYLEPYNVAVTRINDNVEVLRRDFSDSADAQREFSLLAGHVSRKLAEMELSVRMRKQGNEDAWKFVLTTDVGKEHMDAIREQSNQLIARSSGQMALGQQQVSQALQIARIGIAIVAVVGLLAFYMYLRQTLALAQAVQREQQALEHERDRLEELVRQRTAALAELATHLQQVREDERGHLARELHDELGSLLTAAKLDVARLKSKIGAVPEIVERLQHLTETLNSGIALKRRIIEDLRPSSLTHLGLVASLEILTREFAERSGIAMDVNLEPVDGLSDASQLTIYRIVQEALTNIGKYAQASHITVTMHGYSGHVDVKVRDDGQGFDPSTMTPSAYGLAGMRHRVEAAGGRIAIRSAIGQGTTITAHIPRLASSAGKTAAEPAEAA
ncbi:CHASE3 domain-containing protein [Ramlibacter sp. H39-3-26]|uniref:CHASE3 domain-containing protein n=1 Tax=Curvibacter soli TaxID=3031331 RepID=UPI0023DC7B02|nr:CHASE3 domain-containing protein [Ramlibacter sp. H39-3-26]MDF1484810.1 CHASE3 domain-containing protein [Ramlibacter sp. H39-3-26]